MKCHWLRPYFQTFRAFAELKGVIRAYAKTVCKDQAQAAEFKLEMAFDFAATLRILILVSN